MAIVSDKKMLYQRRIDELVKQTEVRQSFNAYWYLMLLVNFWNVIQYR